jgi:PAS domain S-box-containing protein
MDLQKTGVAGSRLETVAFCKSRCNSHMSAPTRKASVPTLLGRGQWRCRVCAQSLSDSYPAWLALRGPSSVPKPLLLLHERVIEALGVERGTSHQPASQVCLRRQALSGATGDATQAAARGQSIGVYADRPSVLTQSIYAAARDITESRQAEEALLKAGALQSAIFNSQNFSSIATDARGVIQIFNVGAERMLGYTAAEVVNKITPANISDPQEMIAHARALSVELGTEIGPGFEALVFKASRGIEDIYELTYIRKNGSRLPAVVSVTALRDAENEIIGYLLIGTDNTARKHAEGERIKLEEVLEHLRQNQMRFKDEFLSHVSHELRSPLTAIKQFTTILLGGLAGELNKEQREYQQIVLKNIRQLQAMIDDLLEVTRLETGKLTVEPERVSVMIAVTDTFNTLEGSARAKGVTLWHNLAPNLPSVLADPTRLRQILIILLDNAIKFTPEGGSVTINAVILPQDARLLVLEVSDTGVGIDPEITENIFERLYQVSERTEGSRKGLGLGLYICKELVMRQGGTIWAKRRSHKGSTFSFTLPVFSLTNSSVKTVPKYLEAAITTPTIPLAVAS